MSLVSCGKLIYRNMLVKKDILFENSIEKQKILLNSFSEPKSDIERSYYQYLCQKQSISPINNFVLNIGSFFIIIFYLYLKKNDKVKIGNRVGAIFASTEENFASIPLSLFEEYSSISQVPLEGFYLNKDDRKFIKEIIKKYRFSFFFLLKVLLKIGIYRSIIIKYCPKAIIVTSEYSFTSSLLTKFCEINKIEHIDIMHGEKLFFIRDSFFHFNRCYVWHQYYVDLFVELKALNNYYIEVPPSQKEWNKEEIIKIIDFTYYLQDQKEEQLLIIHKILTDLKARNYIIAIRPHPVYTNINLINKIFSNVIIENTNNLTIKNSILRTRNVISLFSTVNRQAFTNKIPYIVDDISDVKRFNQLKQLKYFFSNGEFNTLSSYF